MKIEWDFDELYEFADNLRSLSSGFDTHLQDATKKIAEVLLQHIKGLTPIDETGKLIAGWDNNAFLVKPTTNGYEVEIVNTTECAQSVNDGHQAYNQFGGPYPIHNRVKVVSPYKWQKGNKRYYVFGHFFVERGILQLTETKEIESIIYKELEKWWRSV